MAQILPSTSLSKLCQWLLHIPAAQPSIFDIPSHYYLTHQNLSLLRRLVHNQAISAPKRRVTAFKVQSSNLTDDEVQEESELQPQQKSRNQKKKEASRAVKWGMRLAKFSPPQIKRIIRAVSLEDEVFNAVMLVKKLAPDVREGKRRQFNYIGRLLRKAQPDLMEAVLQAMIDGEIDKIYSLSGISKESIDEDVKLGDNESEVEEEIDEDVLFECEEIANRWSEGLISGDSSVTKEVYSIYSVDYDRQELRKLVREVRAKQEFKMLEEATEENLTEENSTKTEESSAVTEVDTALSRARKSLYNFLFWLAKQSNVNAC